MTDVLAHAAHIIAVLGLVAAPLVWGAWRVYSSGQR